MCTLRAAHRAMTTAVVLVMSAVLSRASSYMRGHGVKASELWPHFRNTCNLTCLYGYQTDVEGSFVCMCHDPCKNVLCFWKMQCVVEMPKACPSAYCRPQATCRDMGESQKSPFSKHGVPQADDAASTSAESSYPARCLLSVTSENRKCRKMRVRWYFDSVSGTCKHHYGCRTKGNNFKWRRGCQKACLGSSSIVMSHNQSPMVSVSAVSPHRDQSRLVVTTPDLRSGQRDRGPKSKVRLAVPFSCSITPIPVTSGCHKVRRRWYFDATSQTCRKFRSCPTAGNNFRKKRHCKNRCLRMGKASRRKGRRYRSRSASQ